MLRIGDGPVEAELMHTDGYGLRYAADETYFKHWVIYTKGEADQFLCIEPYTWLPNAPNLNLPTSVTGLIEIAPEQTIELSTSLHMIYPDDTK